MNMIKYCNHLIFHFLIYLIMFRFIAHKPLRSFSQSIKNSSIPFNFKLHETSESLANQARNIQKQSFKTVKLKRKGLDKYNLKRVENLTREKMQPMSTIDKNYLETQIERIKNRQRTQKFNDHDYHRGEQMIEDIPTDPYYSYKIKDFIQALQEWKATKERFGNPEIPPEDYEDFVKHRKIIQAYLEKEETFELQKYERYLKEYPGSPKGPHPNDDPEVFGEYALEKMPQVLKVHLFGDKEIAQNQKPKENLPKSLTSFDVMAKDRVYDRITERVSEELNRDIAEEIKEMKMMRYYDEMPLIPKIPFNEYHEWMTRMVEWTTFKNYYEYPGAKKILEKYFQLLNEVETVIEERQGKQYFELKPKAYSLYTYYQTLPKQIREHPGVRTVYLGLEYSQPDMNYQQKENALNLAAYFSLPMDEVSNFIMDELLVKKKYYLTPYLVDKIQTIHPEFTWDLQQFLTEIKQERLKSQSTIKQEQKFYPEPPQIHLEWEEGMANLPVDYYDNDDGFWDEIIEQKLAKYQKATPMLTQRKHFFH